MKNNIECVIKYHNDILGWLVQDGYSVYLYFPKGKKSFKSVEEAEQNLWKFIKESKISCRKKDIKIWA